MSVPLWEKPLWAKVVWTYTSTGDPCPPDRFPYTAPDGRSYCGKCPKDYLWLIAFNEPETCYKCSPDYAIMTATYETGSQQCVLLGTSDWQQVSGRKAPIDYRSAQEIWMQGAPWTNGRNDGNGIESGRSYDLGKGGRIFMKFQADGAGQYMAVTSWMSPQMAPKPLSTHHSWAGSVGIPDRKWL